MGNCDNLAIVKEFLKALAGLDKNALASLLADDAVWEIAATSLGAEPQYGKGIAEMLVTSLGEVFSPGAMKFNIARTAVDGDTVVLEINTVATTKGGLEYNNWYVHWYELKNGEITLWREHVDSRYAADVQAQLIAEG